VRDPGGGSAKGFYPLRELGSDIEGLRFYQPIAKSGRVAADTAAATERGEHGNR